MSVLRAIPLRAMIGCYGGWHLHRNGRDCPDPPEDHIVLAGLSLSEQDRVSVRCHGGGTAMTFVPYNRD